jgi:phytoene dehydrogenase-like protein
MADYDAIVIGAGHNGLAAAVMLQRAGLRTLCLESKRYAGGMASTVGLFDGYRFEIAGSVQFPTSATVSRELGLDNLPGIDLDVMSVALRGVGDDPVIQYTDPMKLLNHLNEVHGADAVNGMAGLLAWSQAPTRALGRFEAGAAPKTFDEMYTCATNQFERSAIDDMLFGSVTDVLDRYLPDRDKHGALRGSFTVLAVNTIYRGPATPGSAAALAFGLGVPDAETVLMKKLRGGIGALTSHLQGRFENDGGEVRLRAKVTEIVVADGRVRGVRTESGDALTAPIVVSAVAPDLTITQLIEPAALPADIRERFSCTDHRSSYLQMHFALDEAPVFAAPYQALNNPDMQASMGIFSTPEEVQQQWEDCRRGIVPADPTVVLQVPSLHDPGLAPPGKHAASAFALCFPVEAGPYGQMKAEMGQRVIGKITRLAPNFAHSIIRHTTFTPRHMETMFGAPGGDYCHGLLHPDQIGPNRPGPTGFVGQPIPIDGLYLGSAGCHGGPGITFIPGYNAAHQALAEVGRKVDRPSSSSEAASEHDQLPGWQREMLLARADAHGS